MNMTDTIKKILFFLLVIVLIVDSFPVRSLAAGQKSAVPVGITCQLTGEQDARTGDVIILPDSAAPACRCCP